MRSRIVLLAGLAFSLGWHHAAAQTGSAITIVEPGAVETVEPCSSVRGSIGRVIKRNIVEGLTTVDSETGEVKPLLATSWEQLEPTKWRFKLRDDVTFHDGTPMNADAVAFSIKRTMNPDLGCVNYSKFFSSMTLEPTAIDATTVEIVTDPAQPILPTLLANMTIVSANTPAGEQTREPIATGPYKFASWSPESVVLERFEDYWGDKPEVEKVTYVWRSESAVRAAMVTSGEADIAPSISPQDATNPKTDHSYLTSATLSFQITADRPPLDDVRFRKALNLAVDRDAFVGTVLSSEVKPATQFVIPGIVGYNPDIKPWAFDPEQAKALLAEAKADGVPVDQEIVVAGTAFFPNANELLEAIAQMWQAVGINARAQIYEPAQFNDLRTKPYAEDRPPMLFIDDHDNNSGDAAITLLFKYHSGGRHSNLNDAELDKLITDGAAASGAERQELFQKAFWRVTQDLVAEVTLFHLVGYARVGERLDFTPQTAADAELPVAEIKLKR